MSTEAFQLNAFQFDAFQSDVEATVPLAATGPRVSRIVGTTPVASQIIATGPRVSRIVAGPGRRL